MIKLLVFVILGVSFSLTVSAQSTDLNFPTAVTTNEINGTVKARDIGDPRVTSYFYTFDGGQGDVFINAVTKNFNGDIDVFTAEGLRPLTKMVLYADTGESETGRLIYLRKPDRLILRVEGRSPNDDPATFRIKFAGSFIAAAAQKSQQDPTVAKQDADPESGVRVNSVGTIVAVIPKSQSAAIEKSDARETVASENGKGEKTVLPRKPPDNLPSPTPPAAMKTPIVKAQKPPIFTPKPPAKRADVAKNNRTAANKPAKKETSGVNTIIKRPSSSQREAAAQKPASTASKPVAPRAAKAPDPMASIRLVVQLKAGDVIERPMNEVRKFSVDKGVLTVVGNDGSIVRYSILDVAKVTIQ